MMSTASAPSTNGERLSRDDWIDAARRALVRGGVAEVKVDRLATELKVTRGSFYWHFTSRADLLDALLDSWRHTNTEPFLNVLGRNQDQPAVQLQDFFMIWVEEQPFDPACDSALRDWARTSPRVARLVREADETRMGVLRTIFAAFGYETLEAEVRARVTYYHQVGYYAMRVSESQQARGKLFATYFKVLSGVPLPNLPGPTGSQPKRRRV